MNEEERRNLNRTLYNFKWRKELLSQAREFYEREGTAEDKLMSRIVCDATNSLRAIYFTQKTSVGSDGIEKYVLPHLQQHVPKELAREARRLQARRERLFDGSIGYRTQKIWEQIRRNYPELIKKGELGWLQRFEKLLDNAIGVYSGLVESIE